MIASRLIFRDAAIMMRAPKIVPCIVTVQGCGRVFIQLSSSSLNRRVVEFRFSRDQRTAYYIPSHAYSRALITDAACELGRVRWHRPSHLPVDALRVILMLAGRRFVEASSRSRSFWQRLIPSECPRKLVVLRRGTHAKAAVVVQGVQPHIDCRRHTL